MERESDARIIREVLAGDRERFGSLIERHGRAVLGFLERRVDPEEARELFQETLVQAFEGLGGLREPERLRSWMISIAHNLLRRGRRRQPAMRLDQEALDARSAAASSVEPADSRELIEERAQRIRAAFGRLPQRQREVFELRVVAELSHAAIAERLGIREDNARANYYQAVRRLRAELEDHA